ncbi:MAG: type II toxin-antitoxin system VapC family toxin [Bryobacteraceae bacterium]|nr:type II toxin-antitoxin system VapC family toxin [Bryobacteraceae bacterium]
MIGPVVVDASVALAWGFPDERSEYADAVLVALEGRPIAVPAIWMSEVANAILVGERKERVREADVVRFLALLDGLPIVPESPTLNALAAMALPLARRFGLSAYDAAYLELAIRIGAPLATLDRKMSEAAKSAGGSLFAETP